MCPFFMIAPGIAQKENIMTEVALSDLNLQFIKKNNIMNP